MVLLRHRSDYIVPLLCQCLYILLRKKTRVLTIGLSQCDHHHNPLSPTAFSFASLNSLTTPLPLVPSVPNHICLLAILRLWETHACLRDLPLLVPLPAVFLPHICMSLSLSL